MTSVITSKIEQRKQDRKERKNRISQCNNKARLQHGVLKVSKKFIKSL